MSAGMDDVHGALARLTDATMARIAAAEMQRNEARERANRAEALLRECDKELAEMSGAVADLLCDPAWVVLHNHGWAILKDRRPKVDTLIARIREALQ